MLGCVLLKWHITIENEFPNHPIVTKVNNILNKDKILQWNRCVEEAFKVDNQMFPSFKYLLKFPVSYL